MVKQLIKEAMDKNPIGLKEVLQEELKARIALALESKMDKEDDHDSDGYEKMDEAKRPVTKDAVIKLLVKYGNNPKDVKSMVEKEFDMAVKSYPDATAAKIAEVIRTVA